MWFGVIDNYNTVPAIQETGWKFAPRRRLEHDMTRRFAWLLGMGLTMGAVAAAQSPAKYQPPRTEGGRPDLQGVWNFSSAVPLQRPEALAGKTTLTKEEFEQRRAARVDLRDVIDKFAAVENVGLDWLDNTPLVEDLRTSLITYPENGRLPALVEGVRAGFRPEDLLEAIADPNRGIAAVAPVLAAFGGGAKNSYTDFNPGERCLTAIEVPFLPQLDSNYVQIIQAADHVALVTDSDRRLIALNAAPPPAQTPRSWTGVSRGHWEGDTLVVVTTHFNGRTSSFAGSGRSRDKVVTERFTRISPTVLHYAATVVDPSTFKDRIELWFPMALVDTAIHEAGCHEGNYSLPLALSGARAEDEARKQQRRLGPHQRLTMLDRAGTVVATIGEPGLYTQAAFSPDASRLAVIRTDIETGNPDVWTFDVATGRGQPVTSDAFVDSAPVWSPDGKMIAYSSVRDGATTVVRRAADGSGSEEVLLRQEAGNGAILTDWSLDGRFLTFWSNQGLFILPLTGTRQPLRIGDGRGARFSPDGRWLAYNGPDSSQAGRFHVFVRPLDGAALGTTSPSSVRQVSQAHAIGGIAWRDDGRELYFLSQAPPAQTMMAADMTGSEPSSPRPLFQAPPGLGAVAQLSRISSPDGQRFVFPVTAPATAATAK